jgi:NTP pyrophosphatase (non-canonical NTP hydrolase)
MSTGKAMGEWLADTIDAAEFMASKMEQARATPKLVARELHSYALGLTDMTTELLDKMKKPKVTQIDGKRSAAVGETLGDFADDLKKRANAPLTPPSSNTGGKVPKNPKKTGGAK